MKVLIFVFSMVIISAYSQTSVNSSWFKTNKEKKEFLFSFPNVYSTLEGSFAQVRALQGSGKSISKNGHEMETIANFFVAYNTLEKLVAENHPEQLNRKSLESGIAFVNAASCKQLVGQVDSFLVENRISTAQLSAVVSSDGDVNSDEALSILNRLSK